jgi:hypothetical protein
VEDGRRLSHALGSGVVVLLVGVAMCGVIELVCKANRSLKLLSDDAASSSPLVLGPHSSYCCTLVSFPSADVKVVD